MKLVRLLLLSLAALPLGCGDGEGGAASAPRRATARYDGSGKLAEGTHPKASRPNVVLVCLDTVRADAVESRGADAPVMPALAAFCARHTRFVDAAGPAAWTMPAITSLLTGLSPEHHGCHGPGRSGPIVDSIATLAELLRGAGYATAAFSGGGWITKEMGYAQGFDEFTRYDAITTEDGGATLSRWAASVDRAKPYFLFVHSYEAHDPYGRKRPVAGIEDPAFAARVRTYIESIRRRFPTGGSAEAPKDLDRAELFLRWRTEPMTYFGMSGVPGRAAIDGIVHRYLETDFPSDPRREELETALRLAYLDGLKRVDDGFAALMAKLEQVAPRSSTLLIVTTDHGEAFGEQGIVGHGRSLIDPLTRVLIAVRAPERVPVGVVHGSATHADVVPTILDLCGMPASEGVDGVSLVPLANGAAKGRPVEADEYRERFEGDEAVEVRLVSVRDERTKFVATFDPRAALPTEQLFDLVTDPSELHPLGVGDLAPRGPAFVEAVARARARLGALGKGRPK